MKPAYLLQHFIGGEIVESVASLDLDKLKLRAKEIEDEQADLYERMEDGELDDEVWEHETNNEVKEIVYYSYDQYIRNEGGYEEEVEITIREINFLD